MVVDIGGMDESCESIIQIDPTTIDLSRWVPTRSTPDPPSPPAPIADRASVGLIGGGAWGSSGRGARRAAATHCIQQLDRETTAHCILQRPAVEAPSARGTCSFCEVGLAGFGFIFKDSSHVVVPKKSTEAIGRFLFWSTALITSKPILEILPPSVRPSGRPAGRPAASFVLCLCFALSFHVWLVTQSLHARVQITDHGPAPLPPPVSSSPSFAFPVPPALGKSPEASSSTRAST